MGRTGEQQDPAPLALVGRDDERRRLVRFLGAAGPRGLSITGEAGIGKTALWEWARSTAVGEGLVVLSARCVATEVRLPWVGITDLMAGLPVGALERLPEPQRQAIEVATVRSESRDAPPDERGVGTAVLTMLSGLAESSRVLLAIDDLGWLDTASAGALRFGLRRLGDGMSVALLSTQRRSDPDDPAAPVDGLPIARSEELTLGPVTVGALYQLLHRRLDVHFPRPVLVQIHQTSGGNALYALELARTLSRREIMAVPGVPLPLPRSLLRLVEDRIAGLDAEVRTLVASTAATWRPQVPVGSEDVVARGLTEGVIVTVDGVVRAAHPMLGAAAYASLSEPHRHELHRRLAELSQDPVERARHLAVAAPEPDSDVASALDGAVAAVAQRGAPSWAAELARLSLEHTTDPADRPRRWEQLADLLFRAGDTAGAAQAQHQAVDFEPAATARAKRRIRLAEILVESDGEQAAETHLRLTVTESSGDPVTGAEAFLTLAAIAAKAPVAAGFAHQAMVLIQTAPNSDPAILAGVITQVATTRFTAGLGLDHSAFARAIDMERAHPTRRLSDRADAGYAALLKYADDLDGAESRLSVLLLEAEESGDVSSIVYVLSHLPQIYLWRGQIDQAMQVAQRHLQLSQDAAMASQIPVARYLLGVVASYAGDIRLATEILDTEALGAKAPWARQRAYGALGFLALSAGDPRSAVAHLDIWHRELTAIGLGEPGWSRHHLDYVSALVLTGRLDDAETFLAELDSKAAISGRLSAVAAVLAGRGLLAAARGELDAARTAVVEAVARYDELPLRFDLARARMIAGQVHRRAKAKSAARELLSQSLADFREFGAHGWAAQVEAELTRVNVRPSAPAGLTETERRVAELAARGKTNREVADALFLSSKTVEANLSRVYRKLGICSRAELGSRLGRT